MTSSLPPLEEPFVEVKACNTGVAHGTESFMVRGGADVEYTLPLQSYLITHPTEGYTLFDLGLPEESQKPNFGRFHPLYPVFSGFGFELDKDGGTTRQLGKANITADEVKRVILSHFHFDHIGDLHTLPKSELIMGEGVPDLVRGVTKDRGPPFGYWGLEIPADRPITVPTFDTSIGPFNKASDLFGDGTVYLIDSPGHTLGHVMALCKTRHKWVLLAGDAVHHCKNYRGDRPVLKGFGIAEDKSLIELDEDLNASMDTVHKIWLFNQMENVLVAPAHVWIEDVKTISKL